MVDNLTQKSYIFNATPSFFPPLLMYSMRREGRWRAATPAATPAIPRNHQFSFSSSFSSSPAWQTISLASPGTFLLQFQYHQPPTNRLVVVCECGAPKIILRATIKLSLSSLASPPEEEQKKGSQRRKNRFPFVFPSSTDQANLSPG